MKIPIEKKRLFEVLEDLDWRHSFPNHQGWTYSSRYNDVEAVEILADMGFIELWPPTGNFWRIYLKNTFLIQVGLALLREEAIIE